MWMCHQITWHYIVPVNLKLSSTWIMTKWDMGRSYCRWIVTVFESILVSLLSTGLYWRAALPAITMIHHQDRKTQESKVRLGLEMTAIFQFPLSIGFWTTEKMTKKVIVIFNLKETYHSFPNKVSDAHARLYAIWTGLKQGTLSAG